MATVKKSTIKKAQRGCAIDRQAKREDRKAERQWKRMANEGDGAVRRAERRAERQSNREMRGNSIERNAFRNGGKTPAWQRSEGKNPKGGLNAKGVASYRAANPGSKLKTAVTTKPSKLKPGSKAASRRKSFCSRMSGMKKKLTSAKTASDPNSRINKSLRKWNC
jgi:hypothetical protein